MDEQELLQKLQRQFLSDRGHVQMLAQAIQLGLGANNSHTDGPVEDLLVGYYNEEFIADDVMPVILVNKRSDTYYKLKPEIAYNVPDARISSQEAMPSRAGAALDTAGTFSVKDYGLVDFVSNDEEANADAPLQPRLESEEALSGFLGLAREIRVAAVVFGSGNYGSNHSALSGTDRFDNTSSDPAPLILSVIEQPLVRPNVMVIGPDAWRYLRSNTNMIRYITSRPSYKGGQTPFMLDRETVAEAFELERVLVGRAKYNTAREGATASYSNVWGKSMALIRVEKTPSRRRTANFGYSFRFNRGMGGTGFGVQRIYNELVGVSGGTYIKMTHSDDDCVVGGSNVGALRTTVVS